MTGKKLYRAALCMVLTIAMLMSLCVTSFADKSITKGFSADNEELLDEYISVYGWEKDKMLIREWENNSESYYRQVGGQREYLSDCFAGTNDFLMSEAEYDSADGSLILEGNKTATMDFLAKHGIPLGNDASAPMIFGAGANNIVAVALAEVGRTDSVEQPPDSNNVKYNTWYYGHAVSGQDYAWCVVFIMWCAEQAGCADVFPRTAGTDALGNGMQSKGYRYYPIRSTTPFGGSAYTPVPGDIMLFTTGSSISSSKHVGLVVGVESNGIWVVEGNTTGFGQIPGGGVAKVFYDTARLNSYTPARNALIFHVNYPTSITGDSDDPNATSGDLTTYIKGTLGINEAALSAVIANIAAESGGDATRTDAATGAYGLFQWAGADLEAFNAWCQANGRAYDTATAQIQYFAYDLQTNYPNIWNALRSADNSAAGAYQAALSVAGYFGVTGTQLTARAKSAQRDFWPQYAPAEDDNE